MSCKDVKNADKDILASIAKDLRRRKFKVRKGKMIFLLLTSSLKSSCAWRAGKIGTGHKM